MADGTFAVLLVLLSLVDMRQNDCQTDQGCFAKSQVTPRLAFSSGQVIERQASKTTEAYFRYDTRTRRGPLGSALGASFGGDGEKWIGFGATYRLQQSDNPLFAELHFMPGVYLDGGGFDLGGALEFRSGIEFGYEASNGVRVGLSYDHKSNGGTYDQNPRVETIQIRLSILFD